MMEIQTKSAPKAMGPYSQAVICGDYIFCSGQIPLSPETGEIVAGGIKEQTRQVIGNLRAVLLEAGADLGRVVKTEVFLSEMENFSAMNEVYAECFVSKPFPARATVEVSRLPKDVLIEISCIANKINYEKN